MYFTFGGSRALQNGTRCHISYLHVKVICVILVYFDSQFFTPVLYILKAILKNL